jgi:hypothetical protein
MPLAHTLGSPLSPAEFGSSRQETNMIITVISGLIVLAAAVVMIVEWRRQSRLTKDQLRQEHEEQYFWSREW